MVKTRLSRFFLGNLKETERCFLGLACYLPLGGGAAGPGPWEIEVFNQQGGRIPFLQGLLSQVILKNLSLSRRNALENCDVRSYY